MKLILVLFVTFSIFTDFSVASMSGAVDGCSGIANCIDVDFHAEESKSKSLGEKPHCHCHQGHSHNVIIASEAQETLLITRILEHSYPIPSQGNTKSVHTKIKRPPIS